MLQEARTEEVADSVTTAISVRVKVETITAITAREMETAADSAREDHRVARDSSVETAAAMARMARDPSVETVTVRADHSVRVTAQEEASVQAKAVTTTAITAREMETAADSAREDHRVARDVSMVRTKEETDAATDVSAADRTIRDSVPAAQEEAAADPMPSSHQS